MRGNNIWWNLKAGLIYMVLMWKKMPLSHFCFMFFIAIMKNFCQYWGIYSAVFQREVCVCCLSMN